MIVSHRHHAYGDARLGLDRCIVPEGVLRRITLEGVTHDERLTADRIGRGTGVQRARWFACLDGRLAATIEGRPIELGPGDQVFVPRVEDVVVHGGSADTLEIDWNGPAPRSVGWGRLDARLRASAREVAHGLRSARGADPRFTASVESLESALRANGIALEGLARATTLDSPEDQAFVTTLDALLCDLGSAPATVDWERALGGTSRRTVTRRVHAFHQRYELSGLHARTDWRSVRDFYRLLVASILVTHPRATTAGVARALGYGAPAALCHAFTHVGLPSPLRVREIAGR